MDVFLERKTGQPFLIKYIGNQPPNILPAVASVYAIATGRATPVSPNPYSFLRKSGNQNKSNHQMGSVKNLPIANAHVCLKFNNLNQDNFFVSAPGSSAGASSLSLCIYSNSAADNFLCFFGISYKINQKISQIKPIKPVKINAHCQPHFSAIKGTVSGAMIAPILVPELKMPVAKALSFFGNHSAVALIAAGKLPASVIPNAPRATKKPNVLVTNPCAVAAILHNAVAKA